VEADSEICEMEKPKNPRKKKGNQKPNDTPTKADAPKTKKTKPSSLKTVTCAVKRRENQSN